MTFTDRDQVSATGAESPGESGGALAAGLVFEPVPDVADHVPSIPRDDGTAPHVPGMGSGASDANLRRILATYGTSPLLVLTALNTVDELDRIAMVTLAPDIQETFGLSSAAIGAISGMSGMVVVGAAIAIGALGDRRARVPIVGITALLWAVFAGLTGMVRNTFQLVAVRLLSGVGKGSIEPVHTSLLADYYPVEVRGRVLGFHRSANPLAGVAGPALMGAIAAFAGGAAGWRWAFIAAVPLTLIPALASFSLREPRRGQFEDPDAEADTPDTKTPTVPLATAARRLLEIRSLRHMYFGIGVLGFGLVGAPVIVSLYLEEFWGLDELGRGLFFSVGALGPLIGIPIGGAIGDRLFRRHPAWPLHLLAYVIPTWAVLIVGSLYLPTIWMVAGGWVVAGMVLGIATPAFLQLVAATAPPAFRSLAFSLFGVYLYVLGGFFGPAIMGAAADAWDERTALSLLLLPALASGVLLSRGGRFVVDDIAMVADDLAANADARRRNRDRPDDTPNIAELRAIDFSYGQTQVLFGVDLDIPRGEIVALLGTNGAGKSTVLRLLTGLSHPQRGQIRIDGAETTYLEAEQIVGLGVVQMPGGKATFPSMTVEENLQVGAFTFRKENERIEADLAKVFGWFPVLHERRHQLASTLSGGEQQMLGLSKAFLARPKLLCIDELSLGLAPSITADLLGIVREIHANGTTVVVVEQSVNVALALATTAVFMEKGTIRYSGPAADLAGRSDLLRSVFLDGVATGADGSGD